MEEKGVQSLQRFEPVIRFYLSFRDGTGDVERVLGRFAALQQAHKGPSSEGEVSRPEACLELWREGDLFTKAESGQLLLTPFFRSCAKLWVSLFGRRLSCQQRRQDVGRRFPQRLHGSMKAVKLSQKQAVDVLVSSPARMTQSPERCDIAGRRFWAFVDRK